MPISPFSKELVSKPRLVEEAVKHAANKWPAIFDRITAGVLATRYEEKQHSIENQLQRARAGLPDRYASSPKKANTLGRESKQSVFEKRIREYTSSNGSAVAAQAILEQLNSQGQLETKPGELVSAEAKIKKLLSIEGEILGNLMITELTDAQIEYGVRVETVLGFPEAKLQITRKNLVELLTKSGHEMLKDTSKWKFGQWYTLHVLYKEGAVDDEDLRMVEGVWVIPDEQLAYETNDYFEEQRFNS